MSNILQLTIFILIFSIKENSAQTTKGYNEPFSMEDFIKMLADSEKNISLDSQFIPNSQMNLSEELMLPPSTLNQYSLIKTIWALAVGKQEMAEAFDNNTLPSSNSTSENWLQNFQFDPALVYEFVKTTSRINETDSILTQVAVILSRKYNIPIRAAQTGDDLLIIWLKEAGLDMAQIGSKVILSAWEGDQPTTISLLLEVGILDNNAIRDVAFINNSKGETLLHFTAGNGLKLVVKKLLDNGAVVDQKDIHSLTPLYHAMRADKKDIVRLLLKEGADLQTRSQSGETLIHLAVKDNSTVAVSGLLEFGLEIQPEDYEEKTPLLLAAERNYKSLMDLLIDRGADADFKTSSGNTLLHIAVSRGLSNAVRNLIKHGASINSKNNENLTPLYLAADAGYPDAFWFLLNKGASRQDPKSGESLLHIAARRGDQKAIESFVNLCIPVDELDREGLTPLYSAASSGNRSAMELLLSKGADLYVTLGSGLRLLHAATIKGSVAAIESLLKVGTYIDVKDADMLTSLCRAVQNDNIVSVALLIEKGANTSFRTTNGDTLLHIAAAYSSHESIQLLVEHGLDIDSENEQYETPLYLAAKNNNNKTANLLISLGAHKNYITTIGCTLAHLAAMKNDYLALRTLFNIGAEFNAMDKDGYTPLYAAIRNSNVIAANTMIENGVDLYFVDHHNDSLLHIAGRNGDHNVIDFLIDRGIYIDSQGSNGSRPIDVALYNGKCNTAEYFIQKGANIRGRNGQNRTVLHSAVIGDCYDFLRNIAERIDNIDPKDKNLQTPLHWSIILKRTLFSKIFVSLGADVNSVDKSNSTPFQIAVVNRDWDLVLSVLKKEKNLSWNDAQGRTLLHLTAIEDKRTIVKLLTMDKRVNIYAQDIYGRIPLHLAAEEGCFEIMNYLIDERMPKNIDYRDYEGKTPLHLAAIRGHESVVEYLINQGADPLAEDHHQQTPLIYAAKYHKWEVVSRILNKACTISYNTGEDYYNRTILHLAVLDSKLNIISNYKECLEGIINSKDSTGQTPLDLAITEEKLDIVNNFFVDYKFHLKLGNCIALKLAKLELWDVIRSLSTTNINSNCRDEKNRTLLHLAAWQGDTQIILQLLKNPIIDLTARDSENRTALHIAAMRNRRDIVEILLKRGSRKYLRDKDQMTPLTIALAKKAWASIRILLENETELHWTDTYKRTLLHYTAMHGEKDLIRYLLNYIRIDVNAKDISLNTPLHLVAAESALSSYDRRDIINILISHGASWNLLNKQRRSILHLVIESGDEDTLLFILEQFKLDINGQDMFAQTPLHIAVIQGRTDMVATLLSYGADRNVLDFNNFTPLVYAIKNGYDAKELLNDLTDTTWSDAYNRSLLHLSAMHGCSGLVGKLLKPKLKDINVDMIDINDQTPLHLAAEQNYEEIVVLLLRKGANGNHLDKEKRSPLNLAVINESWRAVKVLVRNGCYNEFRYAQNMALIHLAITNGLRDIIDLLINSEIIDLTVTDDFGNTPLHIAARINDIITVEKLLNKRVQKDIFNSKGKNPLTMAAENNSWGSVRALLHGNCDVEGVYDGNRTLLHLAAIDGKKEIIDHLFSCRNVDIDALDSNQETPLDLLLKNHYFDFVYRNFKDKNWRDGKGRTFLHRALLSGEFYIYELYRYGSDAVDNNRQTPLHIASMTGYHNIRDLLRNSISINAVDINGHTPLHLGAMNGHISVIKQILDSSGAKLLNARDFLGRTPLQLSLDYNHDEIAQLLKKYGAKI